METMFRVDMMRLVLFFTIVISYALVQQVHGSQPSRLELWTRYKLLEGKNYDINEDEIRYKYFSKTLDLIETHNNLDNSSFKLSLNRFADFSQEEKSNLKGRKIFNLKNSRVKPYDPERADEKTLSKVIPDWSTNVADHINWTRRVDVVGPVREQGDCGSCWAFTVAQLLEGQEHKAKDSKFGPVVPLSAQQLVDCDFLNKGCNGGSTYNSLLYVDSADGLQTELDYPYKSGHRKDGQVFECKFDKSKAYSSTRNLKKPLSITEGDEDLLKKLVANYGPVAVGFDASEDEFLYYNHGIFYSSRCSNKIMTHTMLVVGYGTSKTNEDYWIVKNSWGTKWGIGGYGLMGRNQNNQCAIATLPIISLTK